MTMLEIKNLHVEVDNKEILKGLNLKIKAGEVHAIMGPNGSGKSTLSYTLTGRDNYHITKGEILFNGKNINELSVHERSLLGIFLAFQYPLTIPGLSNINFLKTAMNTLKQHRGEKEVDAYEFLELVKAKLKSLNMKEDLLTRAVNEGFSGGEKKRNEMLQMSILEPKFAILDETDSGLDIDALKVVADGVNSLRDEKRSFLLITHYQRLLDYIKPDFVHVLADGKIIKSGDYKLALELEEMGYGWVNKTDA